MIGVWFAEVGYTALMQSENDSMFCKIVLRCLWDPAALFNRSFTGTVFRQSIKHGNIAKRALKPRKVDALRSKCRSYCLLQSATPVRGSLKVVLKYAIFANPSCTFVWHQMLLGSYGDILRTRTILVLPCYVTLLLQ